MLACVARNRLVSAHPGVSMHNPGSVFSHRPCLSDGNFLLAANGKLLAAETVDFSLDLITAPWQNVRGCYL